MALIHSKFKPSMIRPVRWAQYPRGTANYKVELWKYFSIHDTLPVRTPEELSNASGEGESEGLHCQPKPQAMSKPVSDTLFGTVSACFGCLHTTQTLHQPLGSTQHTKSPMQKKGLPFPAGPDPQLINSN